MSQSSAIAATSTVSPEGTQEGNREYLPSSSHQTAATLDGAASERENTRYWPQIAEVHIKGMMSVSPDSCIFPYVEKC